MDDLKHIIESEKKMDNIRRQVSDISVAMNYSQEQSLIKICHLFIEYANWMYETGKESGRQTNI